MSASDINPRGRISLFEARERRHRARPEPETQPAPDKEFVFSLSALGRLAPPSVDAADDMNIYLLSPQKHRPSPASTAAASLVQAFITSRPDDCSSLLYDSPTKLINKLPHIQNDAARPLTHSRTRDHLMPALFKLRWLTIIQGIQFKILLVTYKAPSA